MAITNAQQYQQLLAKGGVNNDDALGNLKWIDLT